MVTALKACHGGLVEEIGKDNCLHVITFLETAEVAKFLATCKPLQSLSSLAVQQSVRGTFLEQFTGIGLIKLHEILKYENKIFLKGLPMLFPGLRDIILVDHAFNNVINGEYVCSQVGANGFEFQKRELDPTTGQSKLLPIKIAKRFAGFHLKWYIFDDSQFFYEGDLRLERPGLPSPSTGYPPTTEEYLQDNLAGWLLVNPNDLEVVDIPRWQRVDNNLNPAFNLEVPRQLRRMSLEIEVMRMSSKISF